jgi:hypothetical protein
VTNPSRKFSLLSSQSLSKSSSGLSSHTGGEDEETTKAGDEEKLLSLTAALQVLIHFTVPFNHFYSHFARPSDIDRARMDDFVEKLPQAGPLSPVEAALVKRGLELSATEDDGWQRIWTRSPIHMFKR